MADLLYSVNRQLATAPANLLTQPLVAAPLAASMVHGLLLAATHSHTEALAEHCGVSARTLRKAFQQRLGMPPMEYLRDVRAHEELRAADPDVASVARRWGFAHLGRFAAAREARFGQKPAAYASRITEFVYWTFLFRRAVRSLQFESWNS